MHKTFDSKGVRGASAAIVLALALAGCSESGDGGGAGDGPGGGLGGGGLGGGLGDGLAGVADNGVADDAPLGGNPFGSVEAGGTRDEAGDDTGDIGDTGDDTGDPGQTTTTGGAPTVPFGGGTSTTGPEPVSTAGAVLGRVQNAIIDGELIDAWVCPTTQIEGIDAVAYLFVQDQGALILFPTEGDIASATFGVAEGPAGTLVNTYVEVDLVESISDFRFAGDDRFTASSDTTGALDCVRFFLDEAGGGTDGPGEGPQGGAVSARVENGSTASGGPASLWVCTGPQLPTDATFYAFQGGEGFYAQANEGEEATGQRFTYTEPSPGTLSLAYENGDAETLDGFVFPSEGRFDATSSYDGPVACRLQS